MFTEKEIGYMRSQLLARLATVAPDGQPDVAPVGFEFDGQYFYIGGHNPIKTRKYKNLRSGNQKVALVLDDLESVQPWRPRGIRIYGAADFIDRDGRFGPGIYMRIIPSVSWSWGIETAGLTSGGFGMRKTIHGTESRERRESNEQR